MITICVKTLSMTSHILDVDENWTIIQLKEDIFELLGCSPPTQRLLFNGKACADNKTLREYNIIDSSVVFLRTSLRGD